MYLYRITQYVAHLKSKISASRFSCGYKKRNLKPYCIGTSGFNFKADAYNFVWKIKGNLYITTIHYSIHYNILHVVARS